MPGKGHIWEFLYLGGVLCAGVCRIRTCFLGSIFGPLNFGNSYSPMVSMDIRFEVGTISRSRAYLGGAGSNLGALGILGLLDM